MKRPKELTLFPLDFKKEEDGGFWCRIPSWLVRAYRLKEWGTNMGKVKIILRGFTVSMQERFLQEETKSKYYRENWLIKLNRERKNQHKKGEGK